MSERPVASIVVPTRDRPDYLDVALRSIVPQAENARAEVIVVSDGPNPSTAEVAGRHGVRLASLPEQRSANAARNLGVEASEAELIVLVDDDVEAPDGWLHALLEGAGAAPDYGVFGGPIRARFEGGAPRSCGREPPPITTLDLGASDVDAGLVWSANMMIRRAALETVGPFDERISGHGDEEEWERRYVAAGGRIRYVAGAGLDHRRTRADSTLQALCRAGYAIGRAGRRSDVRKGTIPTLRAELRTLLGCGWHTIRRRCAFGIVMGAEATGRVREVLSPVPDRPAEDFLSGTSGLVFGIRATSRAVAKDAIADAQAAARAIPWRLRHTGARARPRRVLALGIERAEEANLLATAFTELGRSIHDVQFDSTAAGDRGKFENLNALLGRHPVHEFDWLLVVDDDVALPRGFLDSFLFLTERFGLQLAQPAHRARSHAAWEVTRRRAGSVVRETSYVEIGPLVVFHKATFGELLPFPELRAGWGLDAHWSAIARQRNWRLGIVDATPITHGIRKVAAAYDRADAIAEARQFLSGRPYVTADEAQRTLVTHRTWT